MFLQGLSQYVDCWPPFDQHVHATHLLIVVVVPLILVLPFLVQFSMQWGLLMPTIERSTIRRISYELIAGARHTDSRNTDDRMQNMKLLSGLM